MLGWEDLAGKMTLEKRSGGAKAGATFHGEKTASAKVLRQEYGWSTKEQQGGQCGWNRVGEVG